MRNFLSMLGNYQVNRELSSTMQVLYIVVNAFMGLAGVIAVLLFIWIGYRLAKAEDESKRREAKKQMIWAVIATFAIVVFIALWNTIIVDMMASLPENPPELP